MNLLGVIKLKKIALMCDSCADISSQEAKELDIHVIRMPLNVDGKEHIEDVTISEQDIIVAMRNNKIVKTSQPVLGDVLEMWDELLKTYDEVFYLPLSKNLSGTCATTISMSQQYDGRVTVVDSEFVCYPIITVLKWARELFDQGFSCLEVKNKIETESDLYAILIPENMTALKNGGRVSPAAAAIAGMLKICPLLKVEHGAIDLADKVRTLKKAYKQGIENITVGVDPSQYHWMIIDSDNREVSNELKAQLEAIVGQEVEQRTFRAVILSHTGPGTIGFGRIRKFK